MPAKIRFLDGKGGWRVTEDYEQLRERLRARPNEPVEVHIASRHADEGTPPALLFPHAVVGIWPAEDT